MSEYDFVGAAMDDGWMTQGPRVAELEELLGERFRGANVVACSSGTAALHLALMLAGVGPRDEVLVPDLTYVATLNAVLYVGAKPVLVDIRSDDWCMDAEDAHKKVTGRTKAIIPVHLYGRPCDMDGINALAVSHGLRVIEDAAEALGGFYKGSECGTLCPDDGVGVFSFYANKILTTVEGGAVVVKDPRLAERAKLLRGQGQDPNRRFWHTVMGFNYRMSDLHAAVGLAQLKRLESFLEDRQRVCDLYREILSDKMTLQTADDPDVHSAPWLFTGLLSKGTNRQAIASEMAYRGIETRPTFSPLHRLPYVSKLLGQTDTLDSLYPVSCDVGDRGLSLPTYSELTVAQAREIASALKEIL